MFTWSCSGHCRWSYYMVGRKSRTAGHWLLLIVSSSGMILSLLLVAVLFYLKDFVSNYSSFYSVLGILLVVRVVAMVATFFLGFGAIPWVITMQHHNLRVNLLALSDLLEWVTQNVKKFGVEYLRVISVALVMIFPFCCDMHYLILPVNIKSLAGSNATLANWFFFLGGYNDCKFARLGAVELPPPTGTIIYMLVCAFTVAFVTIWVSETKGRELWKKFDCHSDEVSILLFPDFSPFLFSEGSDFCSFHVANDPTDTAEIKYLHFFPWHKSRHYLSPA